jgi:hypothetical protein
MRSVVFAFGLMLMLLSARPTLAESCLHGPDESNPERDRRNAAITFLAQVNAAEAKLERERGMYVALMDAVKVAAIPLSFVARLTFDRWSYIVTLKDTLDPCRYSLFSDQDGMIYQAQPLPPAAEETSQGSSDDER